MRNAPALRAQLLGARRDSGFGTNRANPCCRHAAPPAYAPAEATRPNCPTSLRSVRPTPEPPAMTAQTRQKPLLYMRQRSLKRGSSVSWSACGISHQPTSLNHSASVIFPAQNLPRRSRPSSGHDLRLRQTRLPRARIAAAGLDHHAQSNRSRIIALNGWMNAAGQQRYIGA